ncbi:DUF6113 family protein [Nonomuraea sediminis]|uniref:DUF6113 family protein n=1 Tax=Nonomuraea sediminis TaxID=2835864 RepID=UPI001BDD95E3|nr:DUF6113 family protein [Nonomuraea sediminis]
MEQRSHAEAALKGAAYGMLFVLGLAMGLVGGFTQAFKVGVVPVAAIIWVIVLFCVCLAAGRVMRARLAAALPALGWLLVSMPLSFQLAPGDLVIEGWSGIIYLYGGMAAVVVAFYLSPPSRRDGSWLLRGQLPKSPT